MRLPATVGHKGFDWIPDFCNLGFLFKWYLSSSRCSSLLSSLSHISKVDTDSSSHIWSMAFFVNTIPNKTACDWHLSVLFSVASKTPFMDLASTWQHKLLTKNLTKRLNFWTWPWRVEPSTFLMALSVLQFIKLKGLFVMYLTAALPWFSQLLCFSSPSSSHCWPASHINEAHMLWVCAWMCVYAYMGVCVRRE